MAMQPNPSRWIAYRKPQPQARLRLYCFPYAGSGAGVYRTWQAELPSEIEVWPVQLPGREGRLREPAFRRMKALSEAVAEALGPHFDETPYAFFGHSMGAALAYELTHLLHGRGQRLPRHLMVSGRRGPSVPPRKDPVWDLPEEEFKDELRELKGTPQEVLEHPELMELILPLLRADFELIETYEPTLESLDVSITAFCGVDDEEATRESMEPWSEATRGLFRLRMFDGDHFFLNPLQSLVTAAVTEELAPHFD